MWIYAAKRATDSEVNEYIQFMKVLICLLANRLCSFLFHFEVHQKIFTRIKRNWRQGKLLSA